jgi:hypothetical protein
MAIIGGGAPARSHQFSQNHEITLTLDKSAIEWQLPPSICQQRESAGRAGSQGWYVAFKNDGWCTDD